MSFNLANATNLKKAINNLHKRKSGVNLQMITSWQLYFEMRIRALLFLLIPLSFSSCRIWDGAYRQSRIDLRFVNENQEPIQNIELKVFYSRHGKESFNWPVSNYNINDTILSDSLGIINLYHKRLRGIEFGGWSFLRIIKSSPPSEYCSFYYNGKQVYKIKYDNLYIEMRDSIDFDSDKNLVTCDYIWPSDSVSVENFYYFKKTIEIKNKKNKR
ncbi:MAG: hypothetical protein WCK02_14060 [Bacteroidota bacterium]